ncbi:hypothetical protein AMTRI_Chr03g49960 [Amborella trichopoda]
MDLQKYFAILILIYMILNVVECGCGYKDEAIAYQVIGDQNGGRDYRTVQDAIKSVPSNNTQIVNIVIRPEFTGPSLMTTLFIFFTSSCFFVILDMGQYSDRASSGYGTYYSATITIGTDATNFIATSLTIENTFGYGEQAVALMVSADRAAFYNTLLDDAGRHYFEDCYIEGAVDFICGNGSSFYKNRHLHSISKSNGALTAQKRSSAAENTGFTFFNSCGPYSRVIFAYTYIADIIFPQNFYYGEYQCYGPGANLLTTVPWSYNFTSKEVEPFLSIQVIDGQN